MSSSVPHASTTNRASPPPKKSRKKRSLHGEVVISESSRNRRSHRSPNQSIRLAPPLTSTILQVDSWCAIMAVNDYGGEQNYFWDLQFSGGNVPQYTTSSDRERIRSLAYEEALGASENYALWSAAIATEVGESFASDRDEFLSFIADARGSLSRDEHKIRSMEVSLNASEEDSGRIQEELKISRDEYKTLGDKYFNLGEDKKSLELEKDQ